jgi:hypothetical protein
MDRWVLDNDLFMTHLGEAIVSASPDKAITDAFVAKKTIFGIELTYERVTERSADIKARILMYYYAIYTDKWAVEMTFDPVNHTMMTDDKWYGRGSFDRWMRDASLLKLSGV